MWIAPGTVDVPPPTGPHTRAIAAKEAGDTLRDNEVIYVDRRGPRILRLPIVNPAMPLSRETLKDLEKGIYSGGLAGGSKFPASRMAKNQCLVVGNDGKYSIKKQSTNEDDMNVEPQYFVTLNVWTGEPGVHTDRSIDELYFYSVDEDELPSYHFWKGDKLSRREGSVEAEDNERLSKRSRVRMSLDEKRQEHFAKLDVEAANDPENLLRHKPTIKPSDSDWQGVEEYFKWILENERKQNTQHRIHKIISEEFVKSQQLLLTPCITSSHRSKIQRDNTKRYKKYLETTFKHKEDNLITKLTMLCFGLPVAPLTLANIEYAGGPEDKPDEEEDLGADDEPPTTERIMRSEKPLEFLDRYNERGYGYPIVRTKRKYYDDTNAQKNREDVRKATEAWKAMQESGRLPPMHEGNYCGTSLLRWARSKKEKNLDISEHENIPDRQPLHLRGGAGNPERKVFFYCEMGKFHIDDSYDELEELVYRLFRTTDGQGLMIDLIPIVSATFGPANATTTTIAWSDLTAEVFIDDVSPRLNNHNKWVVRIRSGGKATDDWELDSGVPNLVELRVAGKENVAYWRLPSNSADVIGINQRQDTFRNAVECLLVRHWQYTVKWTIPSTNHNGRLVLAAEAPSVDLWNIVTGLCKDNNVFWVEIAVVSHNRPRLLIPGVVNTDDSLPINSSRGYAKLRTLVQDRTRPRRTDIRVWPNVGSYAADSSDQGSSRTIGPEPGERDQIRWSRDVVVVARPEFGDFCVIDAQNSNRRVPWLGLAGVTLREFRRVLATLWAGYDERTEYIGIVQPMSNVTFIVGPEMTELQWRFQVFDWFESNNIHVQRNLGMGLRYSAQHIRGPLGETIAAKNETGESAQSTATSGANQSQGTIIGGQGAQGNSPLTRWLQVRARQLARLQASHEAYNQDMSVQRGPNNTEMSIFGRPRELEASVGSGSPALFLHSMTPTDAANLGDQNRTLQNSLLDRQEVCLVCNFALPPGPNHDVARRRHFMEHIQVIQNAYNNSSDVGEVFYCEICGRSTEDLARENGGDIANHANACGGKRSFHSIPHFCEYCGRDLWEAGLTREVSEGHIRNCALHRRVTLSGRERLYQLLLQRATGQGTLPDGEHICHFLNCNEVFTSCTPNADRARHFWMHINNNNIEQQATAPQPPVRQLCPFPSCVTDLTAFNNDALTHHFVQHGQHICPWDRCSTKLTGLSEDRLIDHFSEHLSRFCPIDGCGHRFSDPCSHDERLGHLVIHTRALCPFPGCGHTYTYGSSEVEQRQHLLTHTRIQCSFPGCSHVYTDGNSEHEWRWHMLIHTRARCQFPGCDHVFTDGNSEEEQRQHLRTHLDGSAPAAVDPVAAQISPAAQVPSPAQVPLPPPESLDNVPQRVLDQHPGMTLYCPQCLYAVTGRANSMCRRHRGVKCNVQGHDNWVALTPAQLNARKAQRRQAAQAAAGSGNQPQAGAQGSVRRSGSASQNAGTQGRGASQQRNPQRGTGNSRGIVATNNAATISTQVTRGTRRNRDDENNGDNGVGNDGRAGDPKRTRR